MASQAVSSVRLPYVDTRFNSPLPQPFSSLAWEIVDLIFRNLSVVEWNCSRCLCKSFKQYVDLRLYSTEKVRSLFLHANPRVLPFIFPRLSHQVVDFSEGSITVNIYDHVFKIDRITGDRSSIKESDAEVWIFSYPFNSQDYPLHLVSTHGNTRIIDFSTYFEGIPFESKKQKRVAHYNGIKAGNFIDKNSVTCVTEMGTLFQFAISNSEFIRAHQLIPINTEELHNRFVKKGFSAKPFFILSARHPTLGDGIFAYRQRDFSFYRKISASLIACIYQINDRLIIITQRASPAGFVHNPKHDLSIFRVNDTSIALEFIFLLDDCYGNNQSYIVGHHENFLVFMYPKGSHYVFSVVDIKCGKIIKSCTYKKVDDTPQTTNSNKYSAWVYGGALIVGDEIKLNLTIYSLPKLLPISTIDLKEAIPKEECKEVDGFKDLNEGVKNKVKFTKFIQAYFNRNELLLSYSYYVPSENKEKSRTISIKASPEVNSSPSKTLH